MDGIGKFVPPHSSDQYRHFKIGLQNDKSLTLTDYKVRLLNKFIPAVTKKA